MRKSLFLVGLALFVATQAFSQFGISTKYQLNNSTEWNKSVDNVDDILPTSLEYGLNYWFRLKTKRVEFLPELTYSATIGNYDSPGFALELASAKRTTYGLGLNTHIYALDFSGDCNCPTFSKDGNVVSKGFHWIINTAAIMHNLETSYTAPVAGADDVLSPEINSKLTFRFGIGAGLDIGINDLLTITPYALYTRNILPEVPSIELEDLVPTAGPNLISALDQLNFGLRLVLRPDYLKTKRGLYRR